MEHLSSTLLQRYDTDIDLYKVLVFPCELKKRPFEGLGLVYPANVKQLYHKGMSKDKELGSIESWVYVTLLKKFYLGFVFDQ